jgi:tetratricopeptide (TPR) repeat protein
MFATMPGGDRLSALATMGPVLVRYLLRVVLVEPASLVYDVPERAITDPTAMIALAGVAFVLALAAVAWRGGQRAPLLVVAWMLVALAPVSQVLAPLQNRMADRYLMVALAGPCLALGLLGPRLATPSARALAAVALVLALGTPTALRAVMFTQPIALWSEAAERAPRSPIPRYQLGVLLEARDPELAELAYRDAVARSAESTIGRRAAVNLGVLLARRGRLDEAADVLTRAHADAPDDPRAAHDLAVVLDARGEHDRARALLLDVMTRAPAYLPARRSYAQRFGAPPTPEPAAARYDVGDRQF